MVAMRWATLTPPHACAFTESRADSIVSKRNSIGRRMWPPQKGFSVFSGAPRSSHRGETCWQGCVSVSARCTMPSKKLSHVSKKVRTGNSSVLTHITVSRPVVVEETMFFIWEGDE